jgi:iron complex outermembrane receptor protein
MTDLRPASMVWVVLAALLGAVPLSAQELCRAAPSGRAAPAPNAAESRSDPTDPLARTLSLDAGEVTLRAALDLVAASAKVRLTYSSELLPPGARVCASLGDVTVGSALATLLKDAPLQAVAAGPDHVVLAPTRSVVREVQVDPGLPVYELDEILVESSAAEVLARGEAVSRTVISGEELESRGVTTLAEALNVAVPGVWTWGRASAGTTRYAGVRGATSFGVSAPKVYIDGVEAASPLFVSQLLPASVERIEVIRGPQGAGLFGADAIGGVVNIVTRREGVGVNVPRARLQSSVGSSSSGFSPDVGVSQDHALTLRAGGKGRSAGLDLGVASSGEHLPGAYSRSLNAVGSARWMGTRGLLDGTLRYSSASSGAPLSPLLVGPIGFSPDEQSLQQYTLGLTGALERGRWVHRATVGVDGYALEGALGPSGPLLSAADSALRAATGSSSRTTVRLSSAGRFQLSRSAQADLTFSAERYALSQETLIPAPGSHRLGGAADFDLLSTSRTGFGVGARADLSFDDRVYLSGGLRTERTDAVAGLGSAATMPMLSAAVVQDLGPLTVKARAAYGKGIRWPQLAPLPGIPAQVLSDVVLVGVSAEVQEGVEAGVDVSLGERVTLRATRFDQTARGLLQRVGSGMSEMRSRYDRPYLGYRFENVGVIDNRGWELEASVAQGPFSLQGHLSLVDSRVRRLVVGYSGDLRPGDRMLDVPARTLGLTATWDRGPWAASLTASRANDWIGYDRRALVRDLGTTGQPGELSGERLRGYWIGYEGVTHLGASLSRELFGRFTLTLSGDNLLGYQLGEPDNITVLPGRTFHLGVRVAF